MAGPPTTIASGGGLSATARGVSWMIASSFFYAFTYVTIRDLSATFSVFEITFFRALLGAAAMMPWLLRSGFGALRTSRWRLYAFRAVISYTGMVCWFYGLAHLPLADATAIMFTAPLLTIVFLSLLLGERVGHKRWAAILAGFIGAMIIIRPGVIELSLATGALMWTAVSYGASNAATRALAMTERSNAVVFYMFATMIPLSIGPAAAEWTTPSWADLPVILAFGALSLASMQCMTRSLAAVSAYVVMPLFYLQLPFVAVLGFIFYGEVSDVWTWIGAIVICASGYAVVWLEGCARKAGD